MPSDVIADFTAGLWIPEENAPATEQPGFAIPRNGLLTADNVEYLPSGGVKGRRGRTLYNASSLGGAVRGLFRHYTRQGAAATGPNSSAAGGSGSTDIFGFPGTTGPWVNPANVQTLDGAFASLILADQSSQWLVVPGFTFVVPGGATIVGVQVEVARRAHFTVNTAQIYDTDVRLARTGAFVAGDNRAVPAINWRPRYFTTDPTPGFSYWSYGGPADVWGFGNPSPSPTALVPADFNAGNLLAVLIACRGEGGAIQAEIDHVRMTVFYTESPITHKFLAAHVSGANLLYKTGAAGVFSAVTGGTVTLPTDRPRFVNWPEKNATFLFDGLNAVRRFNGTIIETVITGTVNSIPPKRGPYATLWKDRLFTTEPAESNFSIYASALFDETEWPPEAQFSVNDPQGGTITGIVGLADRLLILKSTSLWSFVGDIEFGPGQLSKYSDEGCVAPDSVALTPWGVIFVGRDGVFLTDGENPVPLEVSRAIRPLWVGRTTRAVYPLAVGVYHPRTDRYLLSLDPTGTVVYALQRLSIPDPRGSEPSTVFAWSRITPLPMHAAGVWAGEVDQGELYVGDTGGSVFEADVGSVDPTATNVAIDVLTSQRLFDTEFRRNARIYQIRPLFRAATPAQMALRYDQDLIDTLTFATVGATITVSEQEPRVYVNDKAEMGRFFSARFQHTNAGGGAVELHRIDVDFKLRSRRPWTDPRPT